MAASDEPNLEQLVPSYASTIERKFDKKVATIFKEALLDQFEDLDQLKEDLEYEVDDWGESIFMDELHSNKATFADESMCKKFFGLLKHLINGDDEYEEIPIDLLSPDNINWNVTKKEEEEAQEYLHSQCPGGVFAHKEQDRAMRRTVAVGRKNDIELLSLIIEVYELSHIHNIVHRTRTFTNESQWMRDCKYLKQLNASNSNKPGDMLIQAIREFNKRVTGGGPHQIVLNPIQDDINIYIGYSIMMSKMIHKLILAANALKVSICPLQIDLVICGRRQKQHFDDDAKVDEDDDDPLGMVTPMQFGLPADGVAKMLEAAKMEFDSESISLDNEAHSFRPLEKMLRKKIGNSNNKRIIVLIDRTIEDQDDTVYVYQTSIPQHDEIRKDCSDLHMSWKTKSAILPNYKKPDDELNPLIGGATDFGDNSFVLSFHVHAEDNVKCDQWIKTQRSPFLPYQMCKVWPMYFHKKSRNVDEKYSLKYIYENWGLPIDDEKMQKWMEIIDPKFYEILRELHFAYSQKK